MNNLDKEYQQLLLEYILGNSECRKEKIEPEQVQYQYSDRSNPP
jgi:hypothetical protein